MKNIFNFNKYFKAIIDALFNVFLVLVLLSALYVCCYLLEGKTKLIVFSLLVIITVILLVFEKKKIQIIQELIIDSFSKLSDKKLLLIIVLSMIVLKLFYTIFFYFDPTVTTDIISKYVGYAENFVNNGTLKITIGDNYYFLALLLSIFPRFNIPYHIGMFIILLVSMVINFFSFKDIIGKEKAFIGIMLYVLMPSTMLLTFCPTVEVYQILFTSLFIFLLLKTINKRNIIYSLLLSIVCFVTCKLNYVGYIMIFILLISVIMMNCNHKSKLGIVIALVLSLTLSNLFQYSTSYEWRNTERAYISLIRGTNYKIDGRFSEECPKDMEHLYIHKNVEIKQKIQELLYEVELKDNIKELVQNPKTLFEFIVYKFYIFFSGNHYSIEMLDNINNISNISFYVTLGINEILYILAIVFGISSIFKKEKEDLSVIKLLLLLVIFVLLITETSNRYSLFITPSLYLLCMSKIKQE